MNSKVKALNKQTSAQALLTLCFYFGALLLLFALSNTVLAEGGGSLGEVALEVQSSMFGVAKLISAASYVAGVGFALMGMLKFKAHKDNPTQVSLSQPIVLLAIAAGLVFLPNLISTAGSTIWGSGAESGRGGTKGEAVGGIEEE